MNWVLFSRLAELGLLELALMPPDNNHRHRHALLAIFVLSGFAGLIYQSIWSHYLGLFLGHAAYAQALVLAIFMGGMATGAAWIAHAGQRWRNLIRGYALIEAAIGVLGLLFHWIFTGVAAFSYDWLIPALGSPWAVDIARWSIAALLILPQTILLGMTFPLMSGGLIRRFPGREGSLLGGLYFTNSIGAAIGALAAVFILLPWVGLPGAMVTAGILNFLVAALAWWLAREPEPVPVAPTEAKAAPEQRLLHNPLLRLVLFGTALSGAASFAYEIVWIRMLSMAVGSTMHAFELMLASFIAGIALGGLWVRNHADRTESPLRLVGWMQVGMGVAALVSLGVYANAFSWVGWLMGSLAKSDGGYALFNLGTATIAIAIMLPAAFFAGTTLPLFTVTLLREGLGERAIGRVYAWNTLGSIVGVFAAIHLLIPTLGLKLTLCVAAIVDMGIGLVLLRMQANSSRAMTRFGLAAGVAAVALIAAIRVPFDPLKLASGVFRHGKAELEANSRVLYYRDGKTASVSVVASPQGNVSIATNGKPDASIMMPDENPPTDDEPTMTLAAALPLAMLESPARVGVIGFGSGLTTHTLLGDARLERVDTIEIEAAMVEGARAFGPRVARAYTDPRSHILLDDAKSFISGQKNKYDIIISEPSNPWISGVGALFSEEFYRFVPKHLNDGGVFLQWVQLYEIDDALVGSILKAMTPAFEDYAAWISNGTDLLIVASPKGKLPEPDFQRLMGSNPLKAELARLGIVLPEHLAFRKVADARMLRALSRLHATPANSDYFPILSLAAPASRFKGLMAETTITLPFVSPAVLEALDIRKPLTAKVSPTALRLVPAEGATWQTRKAIADLLGATGTPTSSGTTLRSMAAACPIPLTQPQLNQFSSLMREVSELAIKFLPAQELEGSWINPTWVQCKLLPKDFSRAFELLQAHARRDYHSMETLGRNWLEHKPSAPNLRRDFDAVALSGVLLALAHEERWEELPEAYHQLGNHVFVSDEYAIQFRLLNALAADGIDKGNGKPSRQD